MADLFDLVIALAYLAIAAIIFDRVLAAVRRETFAQFLKFWCLGVAAGLFGLGRVTGTELFYDIAHPCLIVYAAMRIHQIARHNRCRWGKQETA